MVQNMSHNETQMTHAVHLLRTSPLGDAYGFWGRPTATIDWCENNYEHSHYIAEFWNTISNVLFILMGWYGLTQSIKLGFEWRFHAQFIAVMITGIGSAMFHGTLQLVHQQCDETPMVWAALVWIYIVYHGEIERYQISKPLVYSVLSFTGIAFAVLHAINRYTTGFQLFFGAMVVLCLVRLYFHYHKVQNPRARAVAIAYLRFQLWATLFWLLDYHYCAHIQELPVNPQGHAWWHLFMGISSYHGPVFMQYVRMEELQRKGDIEENSFGIHSIVVHDGREATSNKQKVL